MYITMHISAFIVAILSLSVEVRGAKLARSPTRTCDAASETPVSPPPSGYYCGTYGTLNNPQPLAPASQSSNLESCTISCLENSSCISFGYDQDQNTCQLYSARLIGQKYHTKTGGSVVHYNRHCFACPPKPCPTPKTHTRTHTVYFTTTLGSTTSTVTISPTTTVYSASTDSSRKKRGINVRTDCTHTVVTTTETTSVPVATQYSTTITTTVVAPVATQQVTVDCSVCPSFNVINNPGFEDSVLSPWVGTDSGDAGFNSGTTETVDQSDPASGNYSFRTHGGGGANFNDFVLSQSVFVCPGYQYTLSFVAQGSSEYGESVVASIQSFIDGQFTSAFPFDEPLSASYQSFSQSWNGLSNGADAQMITIGIQADGPTFDDIWADNFSFSAVCSR